MEQQSVVGDKLRSLPLKKTRQLYKHSKRINLIIWIWVISIIVSSVLILLPFIMSDTQYREILAEALPGVTQKHIFLFVAGFSVPQILAILSLIARSGTGRFFGIIMCIISLLSIPFGTIIGILGLLALFGSPELFGKNKITHAELKAFHTSW